MSFATVVRGTSTDDWSNTVTAREGKEWFGVQEDKHGSHSKSCGR